MIGGHKQRRPKGDRRSRLRLALVLCLVTAGPTSAAPPVEGLPENGAAVAEALRAVQAAGQDFEVNRTAHYVLIYNGQRDIAIQRGQLLESLYRSYFNFLAKMKIEHQRPGAKLIVLIFEDQADFDTYRRENGFDREQQGASYLQGYYDPRTNRAAFYNQRKGGLYERQKRQMEALALRKLH